MSLQRNEVCIAGNLTRDPELRTTPSGVSVCEVSVATNRNYKDRDGVMQEEATFVEVTLWGKTAEAAAANLVKGRGILVDGRLKLDTWEDKETGSKRSKLRVVGDRFDFTDNKPQDGEPGSGSRPQSRAASTPVNQDADDGDVIPF